MVSTTRLHREIPMFCLHVTLEQLPIRRIVTWEMEQRKLQKWIGFLRSIPNFGFFIDSIVGADL